MSLLRGLWSVFRPMFIPIVGIALIGSFNGPPAAPFVASGLALLFIVVLAWPSNRANRQALLDAVVSLPLLVFGLALVAVAVFGVLAPAENRFVDEYDFLSRAFVTVGFVLWGAVFVLRLFGFARTPARVFLALVLFAVYARYFSSLFLSGDRLPTTSDHVVWGGLLLASVAVVYLLERSGGGPGDRAGWAKRLHVYGLRAAILAGLAFPLAGLMGLWSDPAIHRVQVRDLHEAKARELSPPDVARWVDDPERLAKEFSPVLELTDDQRWLPIDVEQYLDNAELFLRRPQPARGRPLAPRLIQEAPLRPADLARECPSGMKGLCFELTVHCSVQESDDTDCEHGEANPPRGQVTRGTAYVRVLYRDELKAPRGRKAERELERARRDKAFGRRGAVTYGPYHRELAVIVQYWLFYYYDDWKAKTLFGELRQAHEADWEVVTVGLSRTRPLFLGLSAHCGGTWLPWDDVTIAGPPLGMSHPVVGVAEGSQANYHKPEANIPPSNWARCAKLPLDVSTLSLGYKVRDRTGVYTVLTLADLEPVDDDSPIVTFPGYWGRHSTAQFFTAFDRPYELQSEGFGPQSPRHQRLWHDTVLKTFCDKAFKQVGGGRKLPERCPAPIRRD